tara:strand:+ start:505 stop:678 length:174 start_codon:yes stop_codon:yes gene_type:complete
MSGGPLVVIKEMCEDLYKNCVRFIDLVVQQEVFALDVLHSKDMANEGISRYFKEVVK